MRSPQPATSLMPIQPQDGALVYKTGGACTMHNRVCNFCAHNTIRSASQNIITYIKMLLSHLPLITCMCAVISVQHSVGATGPPEDGGVEALPFVDYWMAVQVPSTYAHQVWHLAQQPIDTIQPAQYVQQPDEEIRDAHEIQQDQQQQRKETYGTSATHATTTPRSVEKSEKLDIYLNYASPRRLSYGHVEASPQRVERRFGMRDEGNRYKGMVIWADRQGGYGEQQWDLAQGAI